MAAFTEAYQSTDGGKNHIGDAISMVMAARRMAERERENAEELAERNQTSLEEAGIEKGHFFKAALFHTFGGDWVEDKKEAFKNLKDRTKLLKNPRKNFFTFLDFKGKKRSSTQRFRDALGLNDIMIDDPALRPRSAYPRQQPSSTEKVAQAASGSKQRISREDILSAVSDIAKSLQKTASSINRQAQENTALATSISGMRTDVVSQISERTDSIEGKLDKLIAAVNQQTATLKSSEEKQKNIRQEARLEKQADTDFNEIADDTSTVKDESQTIGATDQQNIEFQMQQMYNMQQDNNPQLEQGGIVSGPDSGYEVTLHGDEMVVPLDNNYTQGEPSAVDGVTRPTPQYEMGSLKQPDITPPKYERGNMGITPLKIPKYSDKPRTAGLQSSPEMNKALVTAMSLPMMVSGGHVLSATQQYQQEIGGRDPRLQAAITAQARPVADIYGLPATLASAPPSAPPPIPAEKTGSSLLKDLQNVINQGRRAPQDTGGGGAAPIASPVGDGVEGDYNEQGSADFAQFLGAKESGNSYTKLVGGREDTSIMEKTVNQLNNEFGGQFAMGRYQIQMRTAREVLRNNGQDPDSFVFNKEGQDQIYHMLLVRRGLNEYLAGEISDEKFARNLSMEWAALPADAGGRSYYAGVGNNKAHLSWDDTLKHVRAMKAKVQQNDPATITETGAANLAEFISKSKSGDRSTFSIDELGLTYQRGRRFFGLGPPIDRLIDQETNTTIFTGTPTVVQNEIQRRLKKKKLLPANGPQAINPPASQPVETMTAMKPDKPIRNSQGQIIALNTPAGQEQSRETSAPPTTQNTAISPGRSSGLEAYYNPNPVA
jgi:hypothetical protein